MPRSDTACFQVFLNAPSRKFARQDILWFSTCAPNHRCRDLVLPGNISLLFLPPYSPELNPKENLGRKSAKYLQELRAQINRRRAHQAQAGDLLYRMQSRNRKIHHLIPLHPQVILMWKWYHLSNNAPSLSRVDNEHVACGRRGRLKICETQVSRVLHSITLQRHCRCPMTVAR